MSETQLIFQLSHPGRSATSQAPKALAEDKLSAIPAHLRRKEKPGLPEVSEMQVVRHYTNLSTKNFAIDKQFYPLGSCTMKYNPRGANRAAMLPGFLNRHPLAPASHSQGHLACMYELQNFLKEVTGMKGVSLAPMAGAQGEFAGVAMIRAYHEARGDDARTEILIPEAAHGTNPATAVMCGYKVREVPVGKDGDVDLEALKEACGPQTAGLMMTNPSTCGVFERQIEAISKAVHDAGGLLYYDGANLNAIMGISRPGDMGFDIVHFNLHKSFTQPHGGGGPGAGPIAVSDRIEPYLMNPRVTRDEGEDGTPRFDLVEDRPESIGRLRGFQGNFGVFVRSYAYICSLGAEGLREASEIAVLNANYLLALLRRPEIAPYLPLAFGERCMHEFVLSGAPMKRDLGLRTTDLAQRLLDHGYHPPTVYFPLLVEEALLVEPTETETRETIEAFADAVGAILREAAEDPEIARNAPYTTPVRRLDEAAAARNPVVRQPAAG
mgnify:CR=1 FL=1